jgi:hypothetical protein
MRKLWASGTHKDKQEVLAYLRPASSPRRPYNTLSSLQHISLMQEGPENSADGQRSSVISYSTFLYFYLDKCTDI